MRKMRMRRALMTGLLIVLASGPALAGVCTRTANKVRQACAKEVRADFAVAVANCLNSNFTSQDIQACKQEAREERVDGNEECGDIREAYGEVCDAIGEGAYDPRIDPNDFVAGISNPFFAMDPNVTYIYEGQTSDGFEHIEVSLTGNTKEILGVTCTEVYDVVFLDGDMIEETWDWYAEDLMGNVWYFGELSFELEDGNIVSLEGSWTAGRDDAKPGIVMPGNPMVGDVYRQEFKVAEAEDMGEVLDLNGAETVPYGGSYTNLLVTRDFTPLDPEADENKYYASGVGVILEIDLETGERIELVAIN